MSIKSSIATLKAKRVHIYSQGWFSHPLIGSHIDVGYTSSDPAVVKRQVESSKAVVAPAVLSMVPDWYGPSHQPSNNYCYQLRRQSEEAGTQFGICIDHNATDVSTQAGLNELVAYVRSAFFQSPAYAKNNGKYMLWNFDLQSIPGLNLTAFQDANPDLMMITENSGQYTYAWPSGFPPDSPQAYMKYYLGRNDQFMIPCLWRLFDDHKVSNPSESAWGGPARFMSAGPTGWDLWNGLVSQISSSGKIFTDIGIATLDDYEEGTRMEPFLLEEYGALITAQGKMFQAINNRRDQG